MISQRAQQFAQREQQEISHTGPSTHKQCCRLVMVILVNSGDGPLNWNSSSGSSGWVMLANSLAKSVHGIRNKVIIFKIVVRVKTKANS